MVLGSSWTLEHSLLQERMLEQHMLGRKQEHMRVHMLEQHKRVHMRGRKPSQEHTQGPHRRGHRLLDHRHRRSSRREQHIQEYNRCRGSSSTHHHYHMRRVHSCLMGSNYRSMVV